MKPITEERQQALIADLQILLLDKDANDDSNSTLISRIALESLTAEEFMRISPKMSENYEAIISKLEYRIEVLESKLASADKLQDSSFRDGLKSGFSFGQTDDQRGFEECLSAYGSKCK